MTSVSGDTHTHTSQLETLQSGFINFTWCTWRTGAHCAPLKQNRQCFCFWRGKHNETHVFWRFLKELLASVFLYLFVFGKTYLSSLMGGALWLFLDIPLLISGNFLRLWNLNIFWGIYSHCLLGLSWTLGRVTSGQLQCREPWVRMPAAGNLCSPLTKNHPGWQQKNSSAKRHIRSSYWVTATSIIGFYSFKRSRMRFPQFRAI